MFFVFFFFILNIQVLNDEHRQVLVNYLTETCNKDNNVKFAGLTSFKIA